MKQKTSPENDHRTRFGFAGLLVALALTLPSLAIAQTAAKANLQPIDLAALCAAAFTNSVSPQSWSALPRGVKTFNGITFKVDGRLAVTGLDAARKGEFHPVSLGIPIGRRAGRLHILHGADNDDKDGVPLAKVVIHYRNGEERSTRFAYGVHARSWARGPEEKKSELLDPNSKQAWTTANDEAEAPGASLRLFQTTLGNPLPDEEIARIEMVSLFSRATPFIAGITLESGADALEVFPSSSRRVVKKSLEHPDPVYHGVFVIRAIDGLTSQPLTNANAVLSISDDEAFFYFGEARADGSGTIRLAYPPQQAVAFTALVRAPGRVPFVFSGTKTNGGDYPREVEARLGPGVKIGGVVRDPGGKPVPEARLVLYRLTRDSAREFTRIDHETVRTDQDGKWTSQAVATLDEMTFELSHPEYRSVTYLQTPQRPGTLFKSVAPEALMAGNAIMELPPALRVEGIVQDQSGKAVPDAELRFVDSGRINPARTLKTDGNGRFKFVAPQPGEISMMVQAKGYRTRLQSISVEPENRSVTLMLAKTSPFRGRVVDQSQQPVAGARVRVDSWNGTKLIQWQTLTDDSGRFVWDSPADGSVMFYVTATNHSSSRISFGNTSGESTVQLRKMSRVFGRVVDAETKKPIDEFTVVKGRAYSAEEPMRWDRYDSARGRNGEYSVRLEEYSSGNSGARSQIMVEAPGYRPVASPPFLKAGLYTNHFEMTKGRGIGGVVELADGSPVANVTLALVERSDYAYMDRPGELRRSGSGGEYQRSNAKGLFEFPAKLEPHTIIAAHENGFAEVRASNVLATGKVVLQPWGRLDGVLRVGKKVEPGWYVSVQSASWRYGEEGRSGAPLSLHLKVEPDANGKFVVDKVPPGERNVYLQFKLNDRENGRTASSHGVPVTVKSGATTEVTVGGGGRPVIGRIAILGGDQEDVDWHRDVHTLQSQMVLPNTLTPPAITGNMSNDERQKAYREYNERQAAFFRTEKGREMQRQQRNYVLLFDTNGNYRVDNVLPGTYTLYVSPTNPDRGDNYYENIGSLNHTVTIPEPAAGKPDEPYDIGKLELQIRGTTRLGKRAPAFETKTFDGKTVKLEDFKGKYVLLDFWATWAGARTLDVQMLKAVHDLYGKDDRLVMLGLNFDHESKVAETAIAQGGFKWTQCYAGSWNASRLPASYGIQGLPEAVLIDPEGKILARNLRGSTIRTRVRNLLSTPRPAVRP
jgi:hypothetical protein